jgi:hypothetical protein
MNKLSEASTMSQQYFQQKEGRTSFFSGPSDAASFVHLIMDLLVITSRKVDGIAGLKKTRTIARGHCDTIYTYLSNLFLADNANGGRMLYKIFSVHAESTLTGLKEEYANISGKQQGKEAKKPVIEFTTNEAKAAKGLIRALGLGFGGAGIKETTEAHVGITPQQAYTIIKPAFVTKENNYKDFVDALFMALLEKSGINELKKLLNNKKYAIEKIGLNSPIGEEITLTDFLAGNLLTILRTTTISQEHAEEIEEISGDINKLNHGLAVKEGRGSQRYSEQSIRSGFGEAKRQLGMIITYVVNVSDVPKLPGQVSQSFNQLTSSYDKATTSRGERKSSKEKLEQQQRSSDEESSEHAQALVAAYELRAMQAKQITALEAKLQALLAAAREKEEASSIVHHQMAVLETENQKLNTSLADLQEEFNSYKNRPARIPLKARQEMEALEVVKSQLLADAETSKRATSELVQTIAQHESTIAQQEQTIERQKRVIESLKSLIFGKLKAYRSKRLREATRGRSDDAEAPATKRHKLSLLGRFDYEEKMEAVKVFKNFVNDKSVTGISAEHVAALKNKRLSHIVLEYAKKALIAQDQAPKGNKATIIDQWIAMETEQRTNPPRQES